MKNKTKKQTENNNLQIIVWSGNLMNEAGNTLDIFFF